MEDEARIMRTFRDVLDTIRRQGEPEEPPIIVEIHDNERVVIASHVTIGEK